MRRVILKSYYSWDRKDPNLLHQFQSKSFHYLIWQRKLHYYVKVKIYNSLGALITTLVQDYQSGGNYTVEWNGLDYNGMFVASGIYLCQLNVDGVTKTRKLLFVE